jgi:hypothetical protein
MRHGFAAIGAVVDHEPKSGFTQPFLFGHELRHAEEMSQQRLVAEFRGGDTLNFLFGDDEQMYRRLRMDIVEGQAAVILKGDSGGNFAGDDLGENRAHGESWPRATETDKDISLFSDDRRRKMLA